ncbi:protein IQ-DOMAIN 11-like [Gastrolobium bilobum]|uniref:protein IQ-DOMAIN 11-like n=1 Tax=Gastrolobium bilobum TaxID=150636 RepID=UPI002AAF15B8|nr:protein IQ-DOMAIN 11-like [Gastrolobium bilobum]XP_061352563.1 protein IQ-DOMAIN 11-like [Gastrolobium bilobum]XP_061352568.1 protein IQ-DOMAIN 11-like [Gastrolobium bilobum]XP_061352573.1 protein IQ-DOMAIN 11-like [Gastrolobium bilobum]XP_061352578.1 protein IQ-DOMAIN 11-like [Gastrolobium bilobum]XP_061352585.1 protein IQ-DOMAIN 11-like [Gastrolobium bilobum]
MAKKKSWFNLVKRLFIWDTHSTQEKKEKRRKWIFGRLKTKRLPSITAPPSSLETIASAEAAAGTADQVVQLTGVSQSAHQCEENSEESQPVKTIDGAPSSTYQCQREIKESAAIKIQTAFRSYLARKALRALKGIVKLQAIIRGRAVRRQAMSTLKCLQSIVSIQSQVCARRLQMVEGRWEEVQDSKDKIIRMDSNSERKWGDSTILTEEVDASCMSKKDTVLKRERIKEYSFNHRRSAESERSKVNGRWRYWLEQWVDTQLSKSKELEDLDSVFSSHSRAREEYGGRQLKLRSTQRQNLVEGLDSPILASRKSFPHRRQCSVGEDHSFSSPLATPAYMAATESAKAKARSTSSPKVRTGNLDTNSDSYSPCKKKLSVVSSNNSEVLISGRMGKLSSTQQRSPSFKGLSVPIKSSRTIKDLSINSDCSLSNWDRQSSFK